MTFNGYCIGIEGIVFEFSYVFQTSVRHPGIVKIGFLICAEAAVRGSYSY